MTEEEFKYTANIIKLDAAASILLTIIPCDKVNQKEITDIITNLRTIRKEINDSYEITDDEVNEEMDADDADQRNLHQEPLNL